MKIRLLFLELLLLQRATSENILIWPAEGSHWINLKPIINELIARGHSVTVAVNSTVLDIDYSEPSPVKYEVFQVPFTNDKIQDLMNAIGQFWLYDKHKYPTGKRTENSQQSWNVESNLPMVCDGMIKNEKLVQKLRDSKFKVVLSDPVHRCGELLALKLGIPFIFSLRFSPGFTVERLCGQIPAPPSYVPAILSEFTDKMSFTERVQNVLYTFMYDWMCKRMWHDLDSYYTEALGEVE
ncbi:LOW QUALITY PROTEIN: UDP-glucuronosyltransferase 2A1-like [Leucoraja erinacea]|uniref:LOW QUALITY PROTEIN: UDP-glucuronosyltransferase 2A1-like n=1 Tax=Leucoraja erinaceus TaxID=7782 RepID=UPI0024572575|nr:LOW QUALITY PROTEIN: UDP-glucuronosyltransferase 2A1-like [Leucoraja erinacea]